MTDNSKNDINPSETVDTPSEHPYFDSFAAGLYPIPEHLLINLNYDYLCRALWVPLREEQKKVFVLIDDLNDILKKDMIKSLLHVKSIEYWHGEKADIIKLIDYFYGVSPSHEAHEQGSSEEAELTTEANANIIKLVNDLIDDAYEKRASDIHIEPDIKDQQVLVRLRIDGECIPYKTFPYEYRAPIVSRVKIMANLDITEKRLPQDGKILYKRSGGEELELRVASIPTYGYTEDLVLRILTRGKIMTLEELGILTEPAHIFANFL